jgi:pyruvate formate lyase activating enzyme
LDTCGFACTSALLELAALADLVLYDVKLIDDGQHREFTGVSNGPIIENLRCLAERHDRIWLRVPLIPGITDQPANLRSIARLAAGLPSVRQVNLLPYHRTGVQKFRRLGMEYRLSDTGPPGPEAIEAAVAEFRTAGVSAVAVG